MRFAWHCESFVNHINNLLGGKTSVLEVFFEVGKLYVEHLSELVSGEMKED